MASPTAITCAEFARTVLRRQYTPAQLVCVKVECDRVQPCTLEGRERNIALEMFGPVETVPEEAYRNIADYFGRDSFKSGMFGVDYPIWRMMTANLASSGLGEVPVVLVVAPDMKLSRMLVRRGLAAVHESPDLAPLLVSESADGFTLRRPEDGKHVAYEAAAASRGGFTVRGRPILALILEEADLHYSGDNYVRTDDETAQGASPRLMRDGSIVAITTPWGDESRTRKLFDANWGNPTTALVAKASTLLMRDNAPDVVANVEAEMANDPLNARREFFVDMTLSAGSAFGDPAVFGACVQAEIPEGYIAGEFLCGADMATLLGNGGDAVAYAIGGYLVPDPTPRYEMVDGAGAFYVEKRDELGYPIQKKLPNRSIFRVVEAGEFSSKDGETQESAVQKIAARAKAWRAKVVTGDQYSPVSAIGYFSQAGMRYVMLPWTSATKMAAVTWIARLARESSLSIAPPNRTGVLMKEAFALKYKHVGGGRIEYFTTGLDTLSAFLAIATYLTNPDAAAIVDRDARPLAGTPYRAHSGRRGEVIRPIDR